MSPSKSLSRSLFAAGLLWSAGLLAAEPLILGIHPYLSASELHERFGPLRAYLEARLGRPIRIDVARDYHSHVERIAEGEVDFAYVSPTLYLHLIEHAGPKRLLARLELDGEPVFWGYIVTRDAGPVRSLMELAGRSFAFGDPGSTMGHAVPRAMLAQAGVPLERLARHEYLGNHVNVAVGVLVGAFDAGAVKEEIFQAYRAKGLRALAKSPEISEHLFLAADHLDGASADALRAALLAVDSPAVLTAIKAKVSRLVPAQDADYDPLRRLLASTPNLYEIRDGSD